MLSTLQQIVIAVRATVLGTRAVGDVAKDTRSWVSDQIEFWKLPTSERDAVRIKKKVLARRSERATRRNIIICVLAVPQLICLGIAFDSKHKDALFFLLALLALQILAAYTLNPIRGEERFLREITGELTVNDKRELAREASSDSAVSAALFGFLLLAVLLTMFQGCF